MLPKKSLNSKLKQILFFFFNLAISLNLVAQTDSLKKSIIYPVTWQNKTGIEQSLEPNFLDTALNKNEIFIPFYSKFGAYQDLGQYGTAVNPVFWQNRQPFGFNLGSNPYQYFFKTPQQAKYYNTKLPLADFTYHQGPNDFLLFDALATANILPNLNVGVDFSRIAGRGFYQQQEVSQYYTQVFGKYQSNNKKWLILANYNWNRGKNDESGGLRNDSLFESLSGNNKAAPLLLSNCESRFKNSIGNLNVYYYLGKPTFQYNENDTTVLFKPKAFLNYEFSRTKTGLYFDNIAGDTSRLLFPNYFFENNSNFKDSLNHEMLSQQFSFHSLLGNGKYYFTTAFKNDVIEVLQRQQTNRYINNSILASLEKISKNNKNELLFKANLQYCFSGYNQNDVLVEMKAGFKTAKLLLNGGVANHLFQPDFTLSIFRSNPFLWQNNFSKTNLTHLFGSLQTTKLKYNYQVAFNQYIYVNFVFINTQALPQQNNDAIVVNTINAEKTFAFKFIRLSNQVIFQQTNTNVIRIPDAIANLRYYADFRVMKVLQLQTGFNIFYNSAYYGNAYNPVSRLFYLQNEKSIGNYPLAEVFVTAMVKKAIFYVKYGHVNANIINTGFYYTPGYPLPLRALYLGLRWRMYN